MRDHPPGAGATGARPPPRTALPDAVVAGATAVGIVGVVIALTQQSVNDLVVALGIALLSLLGCLLLRRRLPARLARLRGPSS